MQHSHLTCFARETFNRFTKIPPANVIVHSHFNIVGGK